MSTIAAEYETWNELITSLQQVEHAPLQHTRLSEELEEVTRALETERKALVTLVGATEKENKALQSVRSRPRRMLVKMRHPSRSGAILSDMESKEEKQLTTALGAEQACRERIAALEAGEQLLVEKVATLASTMATHVALRGQLDGLYVRVFGGPTPEFPEEDEAEEGVEAAKKAVTEAETLVQNRKKAYDFLFQAHGALMEAMKKLADAELYAGWDVMGGGFFAASQKNSHVSAAALLVQTARLFSAQAAVLNPTIDIMPQLNFPEVDFVTDVLFDNVFTDCRYYRTVADAIAAVKAAERTMRTSVGERAKEDVFAARRTLADAEAASAAAVAHLEQVRYAAMATRGAAPPVYDKAPGYDKAL